MEEEINTIKVSKESTHLGCDLFFALGSSGTKPFFYTSSKGKVSKYYIEDNMVTCEEDNDDKCYIEEFIKLNHKAIIKYWSGLLTDEDFLNSLIYIRYSSSSQPSYTSSPKGKIISKEEFYKIQRRIIDETKFDEKINRYDLIEKSLEFYKNNPEYNPNSLGLYISYFIQRMGYKTIFDERLIHLFVAYLKQFNITDNVASFWILHDKALQGDIKSSKELAKQYYLGWDMPDKDYKKCEYFALRSIKDNDKSALFNYALYLTDIRENDVMSLLSSLKILMNIALDIKEDEAYLNILRSILFICSNEELNLDCKELLIGIKDFIDINYSIDNVPWAKEELEKILIDIGVCFFLGSNVKKDLTIARQVLVKVKDLDMAKFYLDCIDALSSSWETRKPKEACIQIEQIRHCKNISECMSIQDVGDLSKTNCFKQKQRYDCFEFGLGFNEQLGLMNKDKLNMVFVKFLNEKLANWKNILI